MDSPAFEITANCACLALEKSTGYDVRLLVLLTLLCCPPSLLCADWILAQERQRDTGTPALSVVSKSIAGDPSVSLHLVLPDPKATRLLVLDNPGNGRRLDQAMAERGCLGGVNGGYFHADFEPIGLVVSEGRKIHGFERARLLSGVLAVREGQPSLLRSAELRPEETLSDGLQAGPFLVDRRRPVKGLEATKQARRTVIVSDQAGLYALAVADAPLTLAQLAALLAAPDIVHELRVERALNLDGGSSAALWSRTSAGQFYLPEWKRVRNFLCVLQHSVGDKR